jgi:hypothetical protein
MAPNVPPMMVTAAAAALFKVCRRVRLIIVTSLYLSLLSVEF